MIDEFLNTQRITDAIARSYFGQGDGVLREFKLKNRRRVDLVTINDKGWIIIIEIKSSPEDFLSDKKWSEYIDWADQFYFGVAHNFPISILPKEHGIITTDGFDVYQAQPSPIHKLNGSRRNNLICKMAKASMRRIEQERNDLITN
tara:strand:+ start:227 stop:664 length:438 start_codon:yes stop_codon:yes gene_type:complete